MTSSTERESVSAVEVEVDQESSVADFSRASTSALYYRHDSVPAPKNRCKRVKQAVAGLIVSLVVAACLTAYVQCLASALRDNEEFEGVFLLTWIINMTPLLTWPLYLSAVLLGNRDTSILKKAWNESLAISSCYDRMSVRRLIGRCSLISLLRTSEGYLLARCVRTGLAPSIALGLYCVHLSFHYLMHWVILHHMFVAVRVVALVVVLSGTVVCFYNDIEIFPADNVWSVIMAALAGGCLALSLLLQDKFFGRVSLSQRSFIHTVCGCLVTVCLWPLILVLHYTAEPIIWTSIPLPYLLASALCFCACELVTMILPTKVPREFASLGALFSVPACAVVDVVWRRLGSQYSSMFIAGVIMITTGSLLVLLPEHWGARLTRLLPIFRLEDTPPQRSEPRGVLKLARIKRDRDRLK